MLAVLAVLSQGKPSASSGNSSSQPKSQTQSSAKTATGGNSSTQPVNEASTGTTQSTAESPGNGSILPTGSGQASGVASVENVNEKNLTFKSGPSQSPATSAGPVVAAFGIWDLVRMVLILGIVVGLIYGVFYLLKRGAGGRLPESNSMRVLGNLQLPGNRTLHLVEAGRQVFLVGGGEHGVSLISEITDQESLDDIHLKYQTASPGIRRNFSELLSGVLASAGLSHRSNAAVSAEAAAEGTGNGQRPRSSVQHASSSSMADEPELWSPQNGDTSKITHGPVDFLRQQRDRLKRLQE